MILARKVALAKWGVIDGLTDDEALRLAIESDLRVDGGQLSLWQCGAGGERECSEVALALAAAMQHFSGIQIVLLQEDRLQELDIDWKPTPGRTPIKTLQDLHVTARVANEPARWSLALEIRRAVSQGRYRTYTRSAVKTLLNAALSAGRLRVSDLSDSVQRRIGKSTQQAI